jgi:hypothetical protein
MKSPLRSMLVAIAAVVALSVVGTASASAHEFEYEIVGKFKRVSNTPQIFTTKAGGNVVECTTDSVSGANPEGGANRKLHLEFAYSGCTVTVGGFPFPATVSSAKYLFNSEGTANLENTVTVSVPATGCKITLPAQENLKPVTYENTPVKDVTFNLKFENAKSQGSINSEGKCVAGENTTGTYAGKTAIEEEGHSWDWK